MRILRHTFAACLLVAISAFVPPAQAVDSATDGKKAEEFVRAAQNYQVAANARVETADALLEIAKEYRRKESADDAQRKVNVKNAGLQELRVGNLLTSAMSGYDKAATTWLRAASVHKKAGNSERSTELTAAAALASETGTAACQAAAEAFEFSAEAFSSIDLSKVASSSDKAAQMRERLANRTR
jgi:hypothetical protein